MTRIAPRVHTRQSDIARLEALALQLPESDKVRVRLLDASTLDGIVQACPVAQMFFDPQGREGTNALLRLELTPPASGAGICDIWLDDIDTVTRMPNPSPPEASTRMPADPNAPVADAADQVDVRSGVAPNRRA